MALDGHVDRETAGHCADEELASKQNHKVNYTLLVPAERLELLQILAGQQVGLGDDSHLSHLDGCINEFVRFGQIACGKISRLEPSLLRLLKVSFGLGIVRRPKAQGIALSSQMDAEESTVFGTVLLRKCMHLVQRLLAQSQKLIVEPQNAAKRRSELGSIAVDLPIPEHAPVEADETWLLLRGRMAVLLVMKPPAKRLAEAVRVSVLVRTLAAFAVPEVLRGDEIDLRVLGNTGDVFDAIVDRDLRTARVEGVAESLLVEHVREGQVLSEEIGQILLAAFTDPGDGKARSTGFQSIPNTCLDVISDIAYSPRIVVAYVDKTFHPCGFVTHAFQGPGDEGCIGLR